MKLKNLPPEEFKILYDSMSQKQLSKVLKVTVNTVMKRVKQYGLETKPKGRPVITNDGFKDEIKDNNAVKRILDKLDL